MVVWRVTTTQKVVALTFDDGPGPYTPFVVAALEDARVPATFFCIGQHAREYRREMAALRTAGFEVENHTWDHALLTQLPRESIINEITSADAVLGPTKYLRPPGGYYSAGVREAIASVGKVLVRWDVDTRDWQHQDVPWILGRVKVRIPLKPIRRSTLMPINDSTRCRSDRSEATL